MTPTDVMVAATLTHDNHAADGGGRVCTRAAVCHEQGTVDCR